jgi:GST-like protein
MADTKWPQNFNFPCGSEPCTQSCACEFLEFSLFISSLNSLHQVAIDKGQQFEPSFLKFSPNNRIPAILDKAPADGGEPIGVFESGAILQYLSAKTGKFGGSTPREQAEVNQWLMWQMGGVGPMFGQYGHFTKYAPVKIEYGIERYEKESKRLLGVLEKHLASTKREFVAGFYSIADMALYTWILSISLSIPVATLFPTVQQWVERIKARDAVAKVYASKDQDYPGSSAPVSDEAKKILFGQSHDNLHKPTDAAK